MTLYYLAGLSQADAAAHRRDRARRAPGASVREVRVTRLVEHIFYADIVLADGTSVDARPSDAIALALVTGAPLLVDEAVLEAPAEIDPDWADEHAAADGHRRPPRPRRRGPQARQSTVSTSLPRTCPSSRSACASAARSSGNVSCTCGRRLPSLTSGVTCSPRS